jgi:uncharacterized protein YjdB
MSVASLTRRLAGLLLCLTVLTACPPDAPQTDSPPGRIASIGFVTTAGTVSSLLLGLRPGQTLQLYATTSDAAGNPVTGVPITWASNTPAVASVSSTGLVTALTIGSTTISATASGISGSLTLRVLSTPVASVSLSPASATVAIGQAVQLSATAKDASGTVLVGRPATWASSAASIATVDTGGTVRGVATGSASVTATVETVTGSAAITVPTASTNPVLFSDDFSAGASASWTGLLGAWSIVSDGSNAWKQGTATGDSWATVGTSAWKDVAVRARIKPLSFQSGGGIVRVFARWQSSSSYYYANLTNDGQVQLRRMASGTITDLAPPKAIGVSVGTWYTLQLSVQGSALAVAVNGVQQLSASDGGITAGGLAAIGGWNSTAEFDDVQVTSLSGTLPPPPPPPAPPATVTVAPATATIAVSATQQLTATVKDSAGNTLTGQPIAWASLTPARATVNSTGLVTGLAAGVDTVTATSSAKVGRSVVTVTAVVPPPTGSTVFVGAGDISDCGNDGDQQTATLLDGIAGTVFTLGDNAYSSGTASEYTDCYNPTWGRHKARTKPSPGNHDYNTSGASGYYGYFGTLAGPSGRGYYSYDVGGWHLVSLNSNVSMSAGSAQETWLRADLAASTTPCTLAYWHHPRFSSGTNHGSDAMSQPIWQALYDAGADVVLSGHEHNYERFAPQTPSGSADASFGLREFIVGTGGESHYSGVSTIANSEVFNGSTFGVLKLTLASTGYTWEFIPVAGSTFRDTGSSACHGKPGGSTGTTITLTGPQGTFDRQSLASGTTIGATGATWTGVTQHMVSIAGPRLSWTGGTVLGQFPSTAPYDPTLHDAYAMIVHGPSPAYTLENFRANDYGDCVSFDGAGSDGFVLRGVRGSACRDDAIEDDDMASGLVDDSWFEGYMSFSARSYHAVPDGSGKVVTIQNSLFRLIDLPPYYLPVVGHGTFWKLDAGKLNPKLALTNNVFRLDSPPVDPSTQGNGYWLIPPADQIASCSGNVIVWTGSGSFPQTNFLPQCFTITSDTKVWDNAVAAWKSRHPALAADYPMFGS